MDERILAILKEVAYGELCSDDGSSYCIYGNCSAWDSSANYGNAVHDAECIVTVARQLLKEQGIPLLVYQIDWECFDGRIAEWVPASSSSYMLAFSEEEVRSVWKEHTDRTVKGVLRRNIVVTLLGEAQALLVP
jgi:hypothetical protein